MTDEAADMIAQLGKGTLLAKSNIKSIFRLLPISPEDFELLCLKLEGFFSILIKWPHLALL